MFYSTGKFSLNRKEDLMHFQTSRYSLDLDGGGLFWKLELVLQSRGYSGKVSRTCLLRVFSVAYLASDGIGISLLLFVLVFFQPAPLFALFVCSRKVST